MSMRNADGSLIIDTELDSTGFAKDAADFQRRVNSLSDTVNKVGDRLRQSFSQSGSYVNLLRENGYSLLAPFSKLADLLKGPVFISMAKFSIATKAFRVIMGGALTVTKKMGQALKDAVGKFVSFKRGARSTEDIVKRMTGAITSFRTLLVQKIKNTFINMITKDIGTAMQQFAKYNSEFNGAMNRIRTMGSTISGNVATLFANLITAVEPIITKLLTMINQAITTISTLFAMLTGKNTVPVATAKVQDYSGATQEAAEAAEDAAEAQKKWNNELYSFDELNRQNRKDEDKSSKSGSASSDPLFTWTEKPIGFSFKNIDFKKLGYDLAEKLANALDRIPWEKIKKAAYNVGDKIAEFLNGAFSNMHLANSLGTTIAEALNTAIQFALGFVRKFDFSQFGTWLGTLWNSFIRKFDFDGLAEVISRGGNGVISALTSFLSTVGQTARDLGVGLGKLWNSIFVGIDFGKLANAILLGVSNLNKILAGLNATIKWDEAARNVINGINTLVRGQVMNANGQMESVWAENGRQVGQLIGGFVHYIHEIINGVDWTAIGTGIAMWFNNALRGINPQDFAGIISGFINGVFNLVYGFITTLDWNALADWISSAVNHMIHTVNWVQIGQTIGTFFKNALGALWRAVNAIDWHSLGKGIGDALEQIDWWGCFTQLASIIFKAFSGMLSGLFSSEGGRAFLALVAAVGGLKLAIGLGGKLVTLAAEGLAKEIAIKLGLIAPAVGAETPKIVAALGTMAKAVGTAALGVLDAFLVIYDVKTLSGAAKTYNEAQQAHNRETQTALSTYERLYREKGKSVADEWAKMAYNIDTTGKNMDQAQQALAKKVDSYWDDVPQNMWQGFKQGWNSYFGAGGKGLFSLIGDAFTGAVNGVKGLLGIHSPSTVFENIGKNLVAGFQSGFNSVWSRTGSALLQAWTNLRDSFGRIQWNNIGHNLVAGLSNGIGGAWSSLTTMVSNCANNLVSRIKSAFGIASPSKVFAEIGTYLDAGLEQGIADGQKSLLRTAGDMAEAVTNGMTPDSPDVEMSADAVVTGMQAVISGLNDIAVTFKTIADTLTATGGFRMPQIAAGTVVPYRTRISDQTASQDTTEAANEVLSRILSELQGQTKAILNGGSGGENVIRLILDGQQIYETVVNRNNSAIRQRGSNPLMGR